MLVATEAAWIVEGSTPEQLVVIPEPTSTWAEANYTIVHGTTVVRFTGYPFGEDGLAQEFAEDVTAATRVP